jgi:hypothetical protein
LAASRLIAAAVDDLPLLLPAKRISDICLPALSRKIPANAFGITARLRLALS